MKGSISQTTSKLVLRLLKRLDCHSSFHHESRKRMSKRDTLGQSPLCEGYQSLFVHATNQHGKMLCSTCIESLIKSDGRECLGFGNINVRAHFALAYLLVRVRCYVRLARNFVYCVQKGVGRHCSCFCTSRKKPSVCSFLPLMILRF